MPDISTDPRFDQLRTQWTSGGSAALFQELAKQFLTEKRFHDLFDIRQMEARLKLQLPVLANTPVDDLPADKQAAMEEAQLSACREVGELLLQDGQLTEAWMYLRVVGERAAMAAVLEAYEPEEEELDAVLNIALQDGVAPTRGFEWVLKHYGTCSAITMFERETPRLKPEPRAAIAKLLTLHLRKELIHSLQLEIRREAGEDPSEETVKELIFDRDWLFQNNAYHIDTSHLSMTVRFARWTQDPEALRAAIELCEYGKHLSAQYQHDGEAPFGELFADHQTFFQVQLGEQVEAGLEHFRQRAETALTEEQGTFPAEVYVTLLNRLGRVQDAFEAHTKYIPGPVAGLFFAPPLWELATRAGAQQRWQQLAAERFDRLGFAASLVS